MAIGPLDRGADDNGPAAPSEMDEAQIALREFLCDGLAAAQEVIHQTLARQQAMMDVVTRVAFANSREASPKAGPEEMNELVAALQSDDLVCQELENLARAQAVMAGAVEEVLGGVDGALGGSPSPAPKDRWTERLMRAVTLEEMRQRFTRHFDVANRD